MINKQKATIGIITCRRPVGLTRLLDSLTQQSISENTELDIIVVDNACEQETTAIVNQIQLKSRFHIHYREQPEPGIVAARNKCVEQFLLLGSDFLIFIDDDEWPEKNDWAQKMIDAQNQYQAHVIASHVISQGETGTPAWATQLLYGENKAIDGQVLTTFYTGNLLISRELLEKMHPVFDSRFAMTGASDYHFSLKCTRKEINAFYVNSPVIEEFPKSRATIKWFTRRGFRSGIGYTRSHLFEDPAIKAIPLCLLMAGARIMKGLTSLTLGTIMLNKLTFVEGLFRLGSGVGSIAGFFGIKYQEYKIIHGN